MDSHSSGQGAALPNLLFDAIEFGLHLQISGCGSNAVDDFRHALHRQGLLVPSTDPRSIRLVVPLDGIADEALDVRLTVTPFGTDGIVIQNVSSVALNPLRLLRAKLGEATCGPKGFDRNDNVIGPTVGRARLLLAKQLEFVRLAVDGLVAGIEAALPTTSEVMVDEFWLRSAEVCLDLPTANATRDVRLLQRAALAGAVRTGIDLYPVDDMYRSRAEDVAGFLVMHWWRTMKGPVFKVYGKRSDVVRPEVACTSRDAIAELTPDRPTTFTDGAEAVSLLLGFALKAAPLLAELVEHVSRAARSSGSVADLIAGLLPLFDLASGRGQGRGRPPSPAAMAAAAEAIEALFTLGSFRALNLRKGCAVRRCLDGLSGPKGPLVRSGRQAIYVLGPEFASAASIIGDRRVPN